MSPKHLIEVNLGERFSRTHSLRLDARRGIVGERLTSADAHRSRDGNCFTDALGFVE